MPGVGAWTCNPSTGEDKDGRVPGVHWPLSSLTGERQANERPRTKGGLLVPEMIPDLQAPHTHLTPPHTHLHTHKLKTTKTTDLKRCHNRLCFRSGLESQSGCLDCTSLQASCREENPYNSTAEDVHLLGQLPHPDEVFRQICS